MKILEKCDYYSFGEKLKKMNGTICDTPFTIDFVLSKLHHDSVEKNVQLQDLIGFDAVDITQGSAFMSQIYRLTLHWKDSRTYPKSLILKVPGVTNAVEYQKQSSGEEVDGQSVGAYLEIAHDKELLFYNIFPAYEEKLKLPKFYYGYEFRLAHNQGIIIMEDMTTNGITVPMLPGFTNEQMCSLMDELALFHATSWKHRDWVEIFEVKPETIQPFVELATQMAENLRAINSEWFSDLLDELLPFFATKTFTKLVLCDGTLEFPTCAVHGDLWAPNVLWEKNENNQAISNVLAIIDWQSMHVGNPCEDICRLLNFNTTGEYRRANTEPLLKRYADKLNELFDGRPPCTYEQLLKAHQLAMVSTCLWGIFGVPMYYSLPSVVGCVDSANFKANRIELLTRARLFLIDTVDHLRSLSIK